jgi:predicted flap endonuclease-1-like 5' DNA nuclease
MSILTDLQDPSSFRARAERSVALPIGMANPLWLVFGAAAGAGAAWWLMTRWVSPFRSEAVPAKALPPAKAAAVEGPVVESTVPAAHVAEALAAEPEPDDLTRLVGVGPRTAGALAARGVTRFADLAAWTAEDMAAFDAEMKLKGRSVRDAWLAQARRLAAEA